MDYKTSRFIIHVAGYNPRFHQFSHVCQVNPDETLALHTRPEIFKY